MTLIILDPNFAHPHGHHMEWDLAIAAAAREREQDTLIFAHRECPLASKEGIEIVPLFSHSTYESKHKDRIVGRFDDFTYFNDTLASELALIPRDRLGATDAVLVPTLTENHLLGYVSWMRTFDAARAPLFILWLMFSSGLGPPAETGASTVADPFQALFYRLAFRRASEPGTPIHFFGGGRQLAREFSELVGSKIDAHAIPTDPRSGIRAADRPAALLFAGDVKVDKGFMLLPGLADRLCAMWPGWDFLIHANSNTSWGPASAAYKELTETVAPRHKNLILLTGRLSREDYLGLMHRADCLVSTYDPILYARKSSGVVWEAISLGLPMLVPANTWLQREAEEWGAACATYKDFSVDGIVESFGVFSESVPALRARCLEAAERYHVHNGLGALMDQIGRLWAPRMLAASLMIQPRSWFLPLEGIEQKGWSFPETLDGHIVRWVDHSFEIGFSWPFDVPWQIDIDAARFMGAKQVTLARAFANERELPTNAIVHASGLSGTLTISGTGDRRRPAVRVRVELPWTKAPPGESRQLGLLVRSVSVCPGETAERTASMGQLEVFTGVTKAVAGGFLLDRVVSGRALMNPHVDNWLHFTAKTNGGPEAARAVEAYVNGIPMRVDSIAIGKSSWAMKVKCGPDILAAIGYWADWDLSLRSGSEAEIWIDNLLVSESGEYVAPAADKLEDVPLAADEPDRIAQNESDESHRQLREGTLITAKAFGEGSGGFHTLEYGEKGSAFRWTGPEPESRFTLRINRTRPVVLTFRILSLGNNRPADLTVKVEGEIFPLRVAELAQSTYAAGPLKTRSGNEPTEVTLRVLRLVRPSGDAATDKRTLGVALEWIRAAPAEG